MQIHIIAVGKIKEPYLNKGIAEYSKRLGRYGRFRVSEVKEESFQEPLSPREKELILEKEADRILPRLNGRASLFVLDRKGQALSSEEFADRFQSLAITGISQIDFVIGGALGLHPKVIQASDLQLSFSKFTFPHQLMRLILVEQIYRAFTIIEGERYHK